eukprot:GCRY01001206.1.p1 GENE.GCRY01001206.1~~GCRY01001206.1.p1  ORF type:complete len:132 (+),score=9.20 GCRY01001206.1:84-479(+)
MVENLSAQEKKAFLATVPRVGTAAFVLNDKNEFIMGTRKGSHGSGKLALPGGHLEFGESWADCVLREVKEETDLDVVDAQYVTCTNDVFEAEKKHYITLFFFCRLKDKQAEPKVVFPLLSPFCCFLFFLFS